MLRRGSKQYKAVYVILETKTVVSFFTNFLKYIRMAKYKGHRQASIYPRQTSERETTFIIHICNK